MTKAEFIDLTAHLDDDTELLAISSYDFDQDARKNAFTVSDLEEMTLYHDKDGDRPVIVLLFNDEED